MENNFAVSIAYLLRYKEKKLQKDIRVTAKKISKRKKVSWQLILRIYCQKRYFSDPPEKIAPRGI